MDNIIERLFAFVDSPRERPWVAMGALGIFILFGAVWVNQAQVLPGVSVSDTGLSGSVVDIMWDTDGEQALALVDNGDDLEMMIRNSQGTWSVLDCSCNVTAIGGTESQWVAGGEDGWIGIMNAGSSSIAPRSFNWPDTSPEIVSLDGDLNDGWLIVEDGSERLVHTWSGLNVSEGASYPISTIVMDEVEVVSGGALIIGHDMAGSNPAQGQASSEVLIDAAGGSGSSPQLVLLHRGAGSPFHTIVPMDDSSFIAIVGGGDAIYGVSADRNVHRIAGSIGVSTIAIDGEGMLWFKGDNGLSTLEIGDAQPTNVICPDGTPTDLTTASSSGDNIVMFSEDGSSRVTIDPSAQHSLLRSLSLLGDLILVLTFVAFAGFGGHALMRKHDII
ncbi:MAG TPA: hypothetical protein QF716_03855 [Candidatus Thalassarchaeaceae archaeon]|nr:hypothetical protein [Candidatus Thalassarchaeaceae archaeon]